MGVIDEIKQKADIVDVISAYSVRLEKSGKNFKALCPFHSEKHGSFFVFPEQQRWHCFGACATGGDIISFVMKREGVDFAQALRIMADKTGVRLTETSGAEEAQKEKLHDVNAAAAEYYHHLLNTSPAAEGVRAYLDKRGVNSWSLSAFQLGHSPDSWDSTLKHLAGKGYNEKDVIDAGLAVQREGGGSYDRFRGRLMFPIRDAQGRVSGFGARSLDGSEPKYMNSPQSPIFDKSSILYGVDRARNAIRRENLAVIVEGYMDVIVAHQHGFENVIASMGTSLTEKQAAILKKLTKRISLALDADAAGTEATLRGIETVDRALDRKVVPVPTHTGRVRLESEADAELSVITLPQGLDPDEVIKQDRESWKKLVQGALPVMDYILTSTASAVDLSQVQGRSELVNRVLPAVAEIKDPVRQSHYINKLAQMVKLDERSLMDAMRQKTRAQRRLRSSTPAVRFSSSIFANPQEDYCLALLLQNPELKENCRDLLPEYFEGSAARELFVRCLGSEDMESFKIDLDPSLQDVVSRLLALELPPTNSVERRHHISDCILRLRENWLRGLESRKAAILQETGPTEPDAQLARLQEQGTDVPQKLLELFHEPSGKRRLRPKGDIKGE